VHAVLTLDDSKRRRDRHEIAAEILESAKFGVRRTHLMCKAKIGYGQLTGYVPMLLEKGLLENSTILQHRQPKHVLKTTEKGEKFLESLRSVDTILANLV